MFNLNYLNTSNVKIRKEKLMDRYIQNYKFNFMNIPKTTLYNPVNKLEDFLLTIYNKNLINYILANTNMVSIHPDVYRYLYDCKNENIYNRMYKGINKGEIISLKQLQNYFNVSDFYLKDNKIYTKYQNKLVDIKRLVHILNNKSFDDLIKEIQLIDNSLNNITKDIICVFIGNLEIGIQLIKKILDSDKKNLSMTIVFKNHELYKQCTNLITNIKNKVVFISKEYGNDIIPSLQAINYMLTNYSHIENIYKFHTKSNQIWFNDLTDYLLNNKLDPNENSNCIGHPSYYVDLNNDKFCKTIVSNNKNSIDKTKFVGGTIFYANRLVYEKVLNFMKKDYLKYFTNNMYDNNIVFKDNSPIHLLERLFGVISLDGKDINYKIIKENKTIEFLNNKLWAHLHCYDIDKFDEIYGEYIENIMKYFSVIVTYSKGSNIPNYIFTILKIENRGMDIGAKMCAVKFLNDKNIIFNFIMMLQSKTNILKRKQFFDPYFSNLNKIISNLNEDIGIYCSNHLYEGNKRFETTNTHCWGRNEIWMNFIIDKFSLPKNNYVFPEGNNYILHREVANYMFDNRFDVYKYLNTINSFDYSWVVNYYKLDNLSEEQVYQKYKRENLYGNNLQLGKGWSGLADCMIEHTFERITFSVCKLLNKKVEIIDYSFNKKLNRYIKFNEPLKTSQVIIVACHTSSELKLLSLMNNLKYFFKIYDIIYIVNSKEFEGDIEKHIEKDEFVKYNYIINNDLTYDQSQIYAQYFPDLMHLSNNNKIKHYKKFGCEEGRKLPGFKKLFIKYQNKSKYVCYQKWYNCLKNDIDFTIHETITLTDDSFLVTKDLPKIQLNDCEMLGIIDNYEYQYRIPDFFRVYNENGIKKWMDYYSNNKNNFYSFYDMITMMEVGILNCFEKTDTFFKVPKKYNKNVHFDKKNRENFYNKTNYPIIKLKELELVDYKIPEYFEKMIPEYILSIL